MTDLTTLTIRPLESGADYSACLALQRETWGMDFEETVPPAILKVAQRLGGVAAGAFDDHGRLLGFVFGMTGIEDGRVVHWSDMLAVRPGVRDAGIGRRLKAWQREAARDVGAEVMYWTFDPLVARNAHLNFNRLGVRPHEYVRDMYGEGDSVLHRGLGTDRLVVAWPLTGDPDSAAAVSDRRRRLDAMAHDAPLPDATTVAAAHGEVPRAVRIELPVDIHAVLARDPTAAWEWRQRSRVAWEWALRTGYQVVGVRRDVTGEEYLLELRADDDRQEKPCD